MQSCGAYGAEIHIITLNVNHINFNAYNSLRPSRFPSDGGIVPVNSFFDKRLPLVKPKHTTKQREGGLELVNHQSKQVIIRLPELTKKPSYLDWSCPGWNQRVCSH